MSRLSILALIAALAGCASTSAKPAFHDASDIVASRTGGKRLYWSNGSVEDAEVERAVTKMLAGDLTEDAAVQIALINNRRLQGIYEELGVAQADVVQAGLLSNPTFSATTRLERRDPLPLQTFGVTQSFLDVFMIPAKKKIANRQLEAAKLRVAAAVLDTAREVRATYWRVQGDEQVVAMRRTVAEASEAAAELARRQNEVGNLSDLDMANQVGLYEDVRLALAKAEQDLVESKEALNRLLGLWGPQVGWRVSGRMPDLPKADPPLDHVERLAVERRLDLDAARMEASATAHAVSLAKDFRFLGAVEIGADLDRHGPGDWDLEPRASIELPIFDQRQAVIARLEARQRQAEMKVSELAVDVRSEVRAARAKLVTARQTAERYRDVIVPLRERIVALSQQQYDAMLIGVYQLLQAKQVEIGAYAEYIDAVRAYWSARADLEWAAGGRIQEEARK